MNKKLFDCALEMKKRSFAPYSNYNVGAAVETKSGDIIGGCNIESSSYGLTCCAERVALYNAVSANHTTFISLAVVTENGGMPCGACRQVIWDLCRNIPIHICNDNGLIKTVHSSNLLPNAFDASLLK
tara:strand:+ start:1886 stop:2269 length:384 start_codon:yes stop_codon:yes gene_type:complete